MGTTDLVENTLGDLRATLDLLRRKACGNMHKTTASNQIHLRLNYVAAYQAKCFAEAFTPESSIKLPRIARVPNCNEYASHRGVVNPGSQLECVAQANAKSSRSLSLLANL